ncbi:3-oxoacyl-ACP synthase III family protein [Massilia sp. Se16.2.3]|nr:3-oxoacyl-ACP synthase III family protein [Massilia sp. Se16.2.3]
MEHRVKIAAITCEMPRERIRNDSPVFARLPETPARWWRFWGIEERGHFSAANDESELLAAERACQRILATMGLRPDDIDMLICSSSAPTLSDSAGVLPHAGVRMHPRLSRVLRERLGVTRALAFDTQVECASFMLNMNIGASYIRSGRAERVLVVCSEYVSQMLDFTSHSCTIFADGCAAALLTRGGEGDVADLIAVDQFSNADHYEVATGRFRHEEGDTRKEGPVKPYFTLSDNGQAELQEFVPENVPKAVARALARTALTPADIDFFVFHQPSPILVYSWASGIGIGEDKYLISTRDTGVMVSVAVPHNLWMALEQGRIAPGDTIVLAGAGIGWGFLAQVWNVDGIVAC